MKTSQIALTFRNTFKQPQKLFDERRRKVEMKSERKREWITQNHNQHMRNEKHTSNAKSNKINSFANVWNATFHRMCARLTFHAVFCRLFFDMKKLVWNSEKIVRKERLIAHSTNVDTVQMANLARIIDCRRANKWKRENNSSKGKYLTFAYHFTLFPLRFVLCRVICAYLKKKTGHERRKNLNWFFFTFSNEEKTRQKHEKSEQKDQSSSDVMLFWCVASTRAHFHSLGTKSSTDEPRNAQMISKRTTSFPRTHVDELSNDDGKCWD